MADASEMACARKKRWEAFLDRRPVPRHLFMIRLPDDGDASRPLPHPANRSASLDWALRKYEHSVGRMERVDDDSVPYLDLLTGTEIFAEAFGCRVHRPADNMPFALPLVSTAQEADAIRVPELSRTRLADILAMAEELRGRAGADAVLRLPDIQSPMDIAALIWDKNTFYIAMVESPEAVVALAAKVAELLVQFMDLWFGRFGPAFVAHYPDYYMPRGLTLSEDEVGAVSSDMFDAYFLPELNRLSHRYGGLGMHCCANARHQWAGFRKIERLRLLNFVQSKRYLTDATAFFADHVPMMHNWCGDGPAETWPSQQPPGARMILEIQAADAVEAGRVCERLRPLCGGVQAA